MPTLELANVRSSDSDAFLRALPAAIAVLRSAPGCVEVSVRRCIERPDEFALLVDWTSVAAHEEFRASPDFAEYRAPIADLLAEPPAFAHYETVQFAE
jgi:quinol monooxygenase YgiN